MIPVPVLTSAALLCGILQSTPGPTIPAPIETPAPAKEFSAYEQPEQPATTPVELRKAVPSDVPSIEKGSPSERPNTGTSPTAAVEKEQQTPPVIQYMAVTPEPVDTTLRVLGNVSTGLLMALGILLLSLRLSVGRPRFPTPYTGRHRRSGQEP